MTGSEQTSQIVPMKPPLSYGAAADRRVQRTRRSVIDAFVQMAVRRPYDAIRIVDVLKAANVGRSTFYAHYRGKDDLLAQVFSVLYEAVAEYVDVVLRGEDDGGHFTMFLAHLKDNRALFRRLTTGSAADDYVRSTRLLERRVAELLGHYCATHDLVPKVPISHGAASTGQSLLGLIREWLLGPDGDAVSAAELAAAMRLLVRVQVFALAGEDWRVTPPRGPRPRPG